MVYRKGIVMLMAAVTLELEMIPEADLKITADYFRKLGIPSKINVPEEKIILHPRSYNQTMKKLVHVIPHMPDVYRLTWNAGDAKAVLFETSEAWDFDVKSEALSCARIFN